MLPYGKFIHTIHNKNNSNNSDWWLELKHKLNKYSKQKMLKWGFSLYEGRRYGKTLPSTISVMHYNRKREKDIHWYKIDKLFLRDRIIPPMIGGGVDNTAHTGASYKCFVENPYWTYDSWKENQKSVGIKNVYIKKGTNLFNYLPDYTNLDYLIVIIQLCKKYGLGQYRIPKLVWLFFNIKMLKAIYDVDMIKLVKERLHNIKFLPYQLKGLDSVTWRELQFQWAININVYIHPHQHIVLNNENIGKTTLVWSRWGYKEELSINDTNHYNKNRLVNTYKGDSPIGGGDITIPALYWFHYDQIIRTRNIIHTLGYVNED